jgi:hypothetical protein
MALLLLAGMDEKPISISTEVPEPNKREIPVTTR